MDTKFGDAATWRLRGADGGLGTKGPNVYLHVSSRKFPAADPPNRTTPEPTGSKTIPACDRGLGEVGGVWLLQELPAES